MQQDYLEVHTPDGRRQVPIGDKPVTIGRHPENGIVITDPAASRRHCVVERTTSGFRVRDLNSSNGTRLNGLVVEQSRLLPGDIITIGGTRIVLVVPSYKSVKSSVKVPAEASANEDTIEDADVLDMGAIEELAGAEEISEDEIVDDDDDAEVLSEEDLVEATDDDEF